MTQTKKSKSKYYLYKLINLTNRNYETSIFNCNSSLLHICSRKRKVEHFDCQRFTALRESPDFEGAKEAINAALQDPETKTKPKHGMLPAWCTKKLRKQKPINRC